MVIDTSALIAILADEPEGDRFIEVIADAPRAKMSAASYVETGIVLERFPDHADGLDDLLNALGIDIVPLSVIQARLAREAFRVYGRGRHAAALNFGDCFSYALAKSAEAPLLFKGNDFARTDIKPAV